MHDENPITDQLSSLSLLRDHLLPNLLKDDEEAILYWAGKELARSFRLNSLEELAEQIQPLFSGRLEKIKESKHTVLYSFSGPLIRHRLTSKKTPNFSLEAGFLAEAYQHITGTYTEATFEIQLKQSLVIFHLQSDQHVTLDTH